MPEPLSARKINLDGSRNIFCPRCHEFICAISGMEAFHSALCIVCQLADQGVTLPQEQLDQLRSRKIGENYVPVIYADPAIQQDPMGDDLSIKTGRIEYFVKVITRKTKQVVKAVIEQSKESRALAKEKRKSRVFDKPIE